MVEAKRIVSNVLFFYSEIIIVNILSFIFIISVARFLGAEEFGKYSFVMAFMSLSILFTDLGLLTFIQREIARNKKLAYQYFNNVLTIKLIVGVLGYLLLLSVYFFTEKSEYLRNLMILSGIIYFLDLLSWTFRALFQAYEQLIYEAVVLAAERIITVGLSFILLSRGYGLIPIFYVLIFGSIISFITFYMITRSRFTPIRLHFDAKFWKFLIKNSWPFCLTTIFFAIYYRIDTIMLNYFKTYLEVGLYNSAYKLIDGLSFIPKAILVASFPAMSILHSTNPNTLKVLYNRAFKYLFLIGLPISIGTTILAERILAFFYGSQYIQAAIVLQILIWAEAFIFLDYLMGSLLNATNRQVLFTISIGITVLLNVIFNLFLIPAYGMVGAAIATLLAELAIFILLSIFTFKAGFKQDVIGITLKPLIGGLVMVGFIYLLREFHIILIISISAAVYFSVLFLLKHLGKEEFDIVKMFLRK